MTPQADFTPDESPDAKARFEAEYIVRQLGAMSPDLKQRFVEDFATAFWTALRGYALPDAKNFANMRFLHNGSEVTQTSGGTTVGLTGGKGQFDIVNFVNGTADIDSASNARQLNVHVGGGGADCMFDFLVSSCFSTLTNWAEGTVFTTLSGCTFIGYTTLGAVMTYINANSTNGQAWTVYLCGITTESVTVTTPSASWSRLHVYGNGINHSGITGTLTFNNADGADVLNFYDLSVGAVTTAGTTFAAPHFYRCSTGAITNGGGGSGFIGLEVHDSLVTSATEAAGGGNWRNVIFDHCTFTGSIQCGTSLLTNTTKFRVTDCLFPSNGQIKLSTPSDGIISRNHFYGTGTPTAANIKITGSTAPLLGLEIAGNRFSGGSTEAPITFATTMTYAEANIVDNMFDTVSGTINYITGPSATSLCCTITGNTFEASDNTPTYFSGNSISGKFINSSFGLNTPASFNVELLSGSSGNIYIGTGTVSGAGASSAETFSPNSASFVTVNSESSLTSERVLTAGTGITLTDAGAGSTLTINATGGGTGGGTAVGARVYRNTNQAITNNTTTAVQFDNETEDSGSMHDNATNNTRVTVPQAGKYTIVGYVQFASNSTGKRVIDIRVNGTTFINSQGKAATAGEGISDQVVSAVYPLNASDYVEVTCYQNSGGNLNVAAATLSVYLIAATNQDRTYQAAIDGSVGSTTVPYAVAGPFPHAGTVTAVYAKTAENVTIGATSWIGDIHLIAAAAQDTDGQGTTLYTTQANRPTIANTHMATTATLPDVTAFAAGDWLAFYTDQAGTNATFITVSVAVSYT